MDYEKLNKERFGRRLSTARAEAGLTQKGLAYLLGMKQAEIAIIEKGKRMPKDAFIRTVCEKLGTDYVWLKYGGDSVYTIKEDEIGRTIMLMHKETDTCDRDAITNCVSTLSDDNAAIVLEIAEALALDQDQDKLNEIVKKEEQAHKEAVHKKRPRLRYDAKLDMAACLANLSDIFPEIFEEMVSGKITVVEADKKARETVYERWPDIKEMVNNGVTEGDSAETREANRLFVHNNVLPLIIHRMKNKI